MGQKVNPVGFRLIHRRDWRSKWFANKQEFGDQLVERVESRGLFLLPLDLRYITPELP